MRKAKRSTSKILHRAAELRKEPTPAEAKLWAYLRTLREDGYHFRHQHAIGTYIIDFCSPSRKLIIEVDGTPFGRSTLTRKNMIPRERHSSRPKATAFCDSGTAK